MIIGAQKCGTSTLFEALKDHPQLIPCREKEPHFFSTTPDWRAELARYHALFPDGPDGALRFEGSTSYTFHPHRTVALWDDLYTYNPALRFIYIVRRPVDRLVSAYMHHVLRGYTQAPPEEAILSKALYLDVTRYATQIRPFIERFGRERVLLLEFDDLVRRQGETLAQVAQFLGIDGSRFASRPPVHNNASIRTPKKPAGGLKPMLKRMLGQGGEPVLAEKPRLSPEFQRRVLGALDLEIDTIAELMGRDLSHWKTIVEPAPARPDEPATLQA